MRDNERMTTGGFIATVYLLFGLFCLVVQTACSVDNGVGLTPPMGWRSWNCFGADVSQEKMTNIMDAMADKSRVDVVTGNGSISLLDVGYNNCGLDDNWQACGAGPQDSFNDENGAPLINTTTFPDMKAMTDHGHSLGLRVGWYMNNCICRENKLKGDDFVEKVWAGSANAVASYGFDGVKLDGCGQFLNLTKWAILLNQTGRPILIENCHWGFTSPDNGAKEVETGADGIVFPSQSNGPCDGTKSPSDCPYNFYRTSVDIQGNWNSMISNLQSVVKYVNHDPPLSRPGAWAYPDMLEVGNWHATFTEDRAHFGAWCISSSPLVLGFDLTNKTTMDRVWSIVANRELIAVNQAWHGSPGILVKKASKSSLFGRPIYQVWSKPVGSSMVAVYLLNNDAPSNERDITFKLADVGVPASATDVSIRCLYEHKDLGKVSGSTFTAKGIQGHDSRFFRLSW